MLSLEDYKFLKDRGSRIFAAIKNLKIKGLRKEHIYSGIQVIGGAGLAAYTYEKKTYGILPFMISAIAVGGTYSFLTVERKNFRKSPFWRIKNWSPWDLASGIFTYSASVYAFSEGFKRNDKMWIPCIAVATSGYYFASSSINSSDIVLNTRPFLKCCQLMLGPVLNACGAIYLFYFQNLKKEWMKCLLFLITGNNGLNIAHRSIHIDVIEDDPQLQLLKAIELLMGGCLLLINCTALSVHTYAYSLCWPLTAFLAVVDIYSVFLIFGSLICFRQYVDIDIPVFFSTVGMILGSLIVSLAGLMVECVEQSDMTPRAFLFLVGTGQSILGFSCYQLYNQVPRPAFYKYCQRMLGSALTVHSSFVSVYAAYCIGWRFSLLTMPFTLAGIYATYRGFKKVERN